jgi:hypothetical protein
MPRITNESDAYSSARRLRVVAESVSARKSGSKTTIGSTQKIRLKR